MTRTGFGTVTQQRCQQRDRDRLRQDPERGLEAADALLDVATREGMQLWIALGTFLEGFAILVLTVPLIQPIIEPLGINMIWFGVMMVIALEMGLISPPVGMKSSETSDSSPGAREGTVRRAQRVSPLVMVGSLER